MAVDHALGPAGSGSLGAAAERATRPGSRVGVPSLRIARHLVLVVLALLTIVPVILVISTALKTDEDVAVDPFGLFTSFSLDSMVRAWVDGNFNDYVLNSFLLSVPSTVLDHRHLHHGRLHLRPAALLRPFGAVLPGGAGTAGAVLHLHDPAVLPAPLDRTAGHAARRDPGADQHRNLLRHLLHARLLLRPARGAGAGGPDRRLLGVADLHPGDAAAGRARESERSRCSPS